MLHQVGVSFDLQNCLLLNQHEGDDAPQDCKFMFCRANCVVTGESGYRSQCTLRVSEDEGLDDKATFRGRKCVLLSTSECSYGYDTQGVGT